MSISVIILGYLLGSISFAYIAGRLGKGVDVREVGTRSAGSHNVMLEVGRLIGSLVAALDIGKGALPVLIARWLGLSDWVALLAGLAAVLGHNYPLYFSFHGGKGAASSLGVLLALMPLEAFVAIAILGLLYLVITKSISTSVIVSFVFLSLLAWWRDKPLALIFAPLALMLVQASAILPETIQMWRSAEDKWDLIINQWIFNRGAKL
jgi:glycerol-3-phosphate acyltransferase PlsY